MRMPWLKWFSRDALGDPKLRMCRPASRGVWYDMLWLMDVAPSRGYLSPNGKPYSDEDLCRALAVTQAELDAAREDLLRNGVPSVDESGVWYNRRMVRDEQKRLLCADAGRSGGGNPRLRKRTPRTPQKTDTQIPDTRCQMPEEPLKDTFKGLLDVTSEQSSTTASEPPVAPFILIPLVNRDGEFAVSQESVDEWIATYPGVDVPQTLREIRAWCIANPAKRKTRNGAMSFINRWLCKEQNRR